MSLRTYTRARSTREAPPRRTKPIPTPTRDDDDDDTDDEAAARDRIGRKVQRVRPAEEEEKEEEKEEQSLVAGEHGSPPPTTAISQALTGTGHLANLLPTGTLLALQLLTPVFTRNGACDPVTRLLTHGLLLLLAASCFVASFTDSFKASDGRVYYGLATLRGMWVFDYPPANALPDLTKYRLRGIDFVHAVLSVLVFGAVSLRDRNVVRCFYPQPQQETQEVLDILPLGLGVICSLLFVVFPTRRHGIGYPVSSGN